MSDTDLVPSQQESEETIAYPWLQMENEPEIWYQRFVKYYVGLGTGRTLLKAMMAYLQQEEPEVYERALINPRESASTAWSNAAKVWMWRDRARSYDMIRLQNAHKLREEAEAILLESAPDAAKALRESLENPKLKVAAAKEILDRSGLPGTIVRENRVVPFTADDLQQATREVADWEQSLLEPPQTSDSSG